MKQLRLCRRRGQQRRERRLYRHRPPRHSRHWRLRRERRLCRSRRWRPRRHSGSFDSQRVRDWGKKEGTTSKRWTGFRPLYRRRSHRLHIHLKALAVIFKVHASLSYFRSLLILQIFSIGAWMRKDLVVVTKETVRNPIHICVAHCSLLVPTNPQRLLHCRRP